MAKYRMEFDAIIVVKANTPDEGLKMAENYVAGLEEGPDQTRAQVIGQDTCPTVLVLSEDGADIEDFDKELRDDEVRDLERGEVPWSMREEDDDDG